MSAVPTLYWRKKNQGAKAVTPSPFKSEQEFEQVVFDTPTVLGDIFLLRRQVRGGSKGGAFPTFWESILMARSASLR